MSDNSQHSNDFEFLPVRLVQISEHQHSQRLDNFLMAQFRTLPKKRIYQMIRKGEVRINGGRAKATTRLKKGDEVRLPPVKIPNTEKIEIPNSAIQSLQNAIIYEDAHLLVINKPSGLAVHKGSGVPYGVIDIVRNLQFNNEANSGEGSFFELVHRLDRETSGILLIAKSGRVLRTLQAEDFPLRRFYQFISTGDFATRVETKRADLHQNREQSSWLTLDKKCYRVSAPLDTEHRIEGERVVIVSRNGKNAETLFTPLHYSPTTDRSLVQAELISGRTHQIRVHAQFCGAPILHDARYNKHESGKNSRLMLHANELRFTLFNKEYTLNAPLPLEFTKAIEQ